MKRYIIFAYEAYYPGGGWSDFCGDFDTVEEAISALDALKPVNKELIDTQTLQDIYVYPHERGDME